MSDSIYRRPNKNIFYVYGYRYPLTGIFYYIGKGSNGRAYAKHGKRIPVPENKDDIIFFAIGLSEDIAFEMEIELIEHYGRQDNGTGILMNRTSGGQGPSGRTGIVPVKDKDGNTFSVPVDDPRLTNGEYVHMRTGIATVKDKEGNISSVSVNDPDYIKGILVHVNTGIKRSQASKDLIGKCHSGENNYRFSGRYHVPHYLEKFTSSYVLENEGLSAPSMRKYCKKNITFISKTCYYGSKFLKAHFGPEIIGQTFKDIGFRFEPI